MLVALALAIVVAIIGLLRGGSFEALARTRFRLPEILFAGLLVQIALDVWQPEWMSDELSLALLLASYAAVVVFLIVNRTLPGLALAGVGIALNMVVIGLNGAMPVSQTAAEISGVQGAFVAEGKHEPLTDETLLAPVADVIPLPGLKQVISLGDVFLALGMAWLVHQRITANKRGRHSLESV